MAFQLFTSLLTVGQLALPFMAIWPFQAAFPRWELAQQLPSIFLHSAREKLANLSSSLYKGTDNGQNNGILWIVTEKREK